jgi:acetamidase/formamidase
MNIPEVRVETDRKWVIDKEGNSMEQALEKACLAMTNFLKERLDLPDERIGLLLSSVGGFHISQAGFYGYPVVLRAEVPKWIDRKGRL